MLFIFIERAEQCGYLTDWIDAHIKNMASTAVDVDKVLLKNSYCIFV